MRLNKARKIRIGTALCILQLNTPVLLRADETLPILKVGSEVYSNVTVTAVTATDIYFTFNKSVANAKLKNLDPALQNHFKYDAAKADAVAQKQRAQASSAAAPATLEGEPNITRATAQAVMDDAMARVRGIVNQPVQKITRTPGMTVSTSSPGWFHEGAIKPDFAGDDVHKTQQTQYAQHAYVTSDLNPGVVFAGSEVEFNSLTKYFYTDRTLPKKKLTEAEMDEINRLYRIIGKCEEKLLPATALAGNFLLANRRTLISGTAVALALLLATRFLLNKRSEANA